MTAASANRAPVRVDIETVRERVARVAANLAAALQRGRARADDLRADAEALRLAAQDLKDLAQRVEKEGRR